MTRRTAREVAAQLIYALGASGETPDELLEDFFEGEHFATLCREDEELFFEKPGGRQKRYIEQLVREAFAHSGELRGYIEKYAQGWKPERISKTASAVLRCAMCEILYVEEVSTAVAINEAVEIAKGYDEPDTVAFINGVLGSFVRGEDIPDRGTDAPERDTEDEPEDAPEETTEAAETVTE